MPPFSCQNLGMSKKARSLVLPIAGSLIAPGIGTALGSTLSGAALGAIGSGVGSLAAGAKPLNAALGAAGSYIGGNVAGNVLGQSPSVATSLESAFGPDLGSVIGQGLGGNIAMNSTNALLGSAIGSNLASSLVPQKTGNVMGEGSTAFAPKREGEQEIPASFRSFGSLTPEQLSSNIATGGVYGGGAGPDETNYFLNMVNRRLVDDSGRVDSDLSEINPIENSFLSQIGLGGMNNATDLLEAINKRRLAA